MLKVFIATVVSFLDDLTYTYIYFSGGGQYGLRLKRSTSTPVAALVISGFAQFVGQPLLTRSIAFTLDGKRGVVACPDCPINIRCVQHAVHALFGKIHSMFEAIAQSTPNT
jgi:hypothetical protein